MSDRFTWERAIRDPKVGMPRDVLCLALLLATYSTGKTGGDIRVSEAALADDLGYDHERSVRRLVAELRDGYGVIRRVRHGNQSGPAEYALVIPGDLAGRAEAARDRRAADLARASRRPERHRAPDAVRPVRPGSAPDAWRSPLRTHGVRLPRRAPRRPRRSVPMTAPFPVGNPVQTVGGRAAASREISTSARSIEGETTP